jgi:hypothetical protein
MDIATFKKEATVIKDSLPHWRNDNTKVEIINYQVGQFMASYHIYRNVNTGEVNSRKRYFKIGDEGLARKAFYKQIENL